MLVGYQKSINVFFILNSHSFEGAAPTIPNSLQATDLWLELETSHGRPRVMVRPRVRVYYVMFFSVKLFRRDSSSLAPNLFGGIFPPLPLFQAAFIVLYSDGRITAYLYIHITVVNYYFLVVIKKKIVNNNIRFLIHITLADMPQPLR